MLNGLLVKLKNEGSVKKAVVWLQARQAPLIKKVKEIIESGRIGEVYSSTWVGQGSVGGEATGMWKFFDSSSWLLFQMSLYVLD
jgi:predicted dehydrogenase